MTLFHTESTYRAYPDSRSTGRYGALMTTLANDRRTPLSVAEIMEQRIANNAAAPHERIAWQEYAFATSDGIAYDNDTLRIALDEPRLRTATMNTLFVNGVRPLPSINSVEGPTFTRDELAPYCNHVLTRQEVMNHPVLLALARDKALLREYAQLVFSEVRARWNDDRGMGVYLTESHTTVADLRPCVVKSIDARSGLSARKSREVRLVGRLLAW